MIDSYPAHPHVYKGLRDTLQVMLTLVFRPWNGDLP